MWEWLISWLPIVPWLLFCASMWRSAYLAHKVNELTAKKETEEKKEQHPDWCTCHDCKVTYTNSVDRVLKEYYGKAKRAKFEADSIASLADHYKESYPETPAPVITTLIKPLAVTQESKDAKQSLREAHERRKAGVYGLCSVCGITHQTPMESCDDAQDRYMRLRGAIR